MNTLKNPLGFSLWETLASGLFCEISRCRCGVYAVRILERFVMRFIRRSQQLDAKPRMPL